MKSNIGIALCLGAFGLAPLPAAADACPGKYADGKGSAPKLVAIPGSYAKTCTDCRVSSMPGLAGAQWGLTATCKTKSGPARTSTLANGNHCRRDTVRNDNGALKCECQGKTKLVSTGDGFACEPT